MAASLIGQTDILLRDTIPIRPVDNVELWLGVEQTDVLLVVETCDIK